MPLQLSQMRGKQLHLCQKMRTKYTLPLNKYKYTPVCTVNDMNITYKTYVRTAYLPLYLKKYFKNLLHSECSTPQCRIKQTINVIYYNNALV